MIGKTRRLGGPTAGGDWVSMHRMNVPRVPSCGLRMRWNESNSGPLELTKLGEDLEEDTGDWEKTLRIEPLQALAGVGA